MSLDVREGEAQHNRSLVSAGQDDYLLRFQNAVRHSSEGLRVTRDNVPVQRRGIFTGS